MSNSIRNIGVKGIFISEIYCCEEDRCQSVRETGVWETYNVMETFVRETGVMETVVSENNVRETAVRDADFRETLNVRETGVR